MAGKPRTMIRRLEQLHQQMDAINEAVLALMPEQYQNNSDDESRTGNVWRTATASVNNAYDDLGGLLGYLLWRLEVAEKRALTATRAAGEVPLAEPE